MTTITTANVAPAPRRRVLRLVFGSLTLLLALAFIGSAIAGIFGLENNRDSTGYFITHAHHYQTASYALSTESFNVGGVTGALGAGLLRLRITATSTDGTKPLFVGIAHTQDVDRYLAQVQHDEVRNVDFDPFTVDYRRLGTGAPTALPATQRFWHASSHGAGKQTISWPVKKGRWSAVVMNDDGSRNVAVRAQLAARLSGAWWWVVAAFVLGALSLLGGAVLVRSGSRASSP